MSAGATDDPSHVQPLEAGEQPSDPDGPPEATGRRAVRQLHACLLAASLLAASDAAWMLRDSVPRASGVALAASLHLLGGVGLAALVVPVGAALRYLPSFDFRLRWLPFVVAGASVLLYAPALRSAFGGGWVVPTTFLVAAAVQYGVALGVLLRLSVGTQLAFLVGSVATSAIVAPACSDLRLFERAHERGLWLAVCVCVSIGAQLLAAIGAALISGWRGSWRLATAATAALVAAALALAPALVLPGQHPAAHLGALIAAEVVAAAAFASAGLGHRVVTAGLFVAALGVITTALALPERAIFAFHTLDDRAALASSLLGPSGVPDWIGRHRLRALLSDDPGDCASLWGVPSPPPIARPLARDASVVLITIDSLRYDHTGYSGAAPPGITPVLDRFAADALRFHAAYAQGGWTSLSLPSILWSRHPKDIEFTPLMEDIHFNLHLPHELPAPAPLCKRFQAPLAQPTASLAEVFAEHGVMTLAVPNDGFTHYFHPRLGFTRGFSSVAYPPEPVDDVPLVDGGDEVTVDLAIDALSTARGRPFFMWVHLFGPHVPYGEPQDGFSSYAADVHATDRHVGRLLEALEASGARDDTLVVVTADHGEALGYHGIGHGLNLFDEAIHVPLMIRGSSLPAGDHRAEVGIVDIAPTILDLLQLDRPPGFEGRSLFEEGPARPVFSETWQYRGLSTMRDVHLVSAIRDGKKVVHDLRTGAWTFFDLSAAPDEARPDPLTTATSRRWARCLVDALDAWHEDVSTPR